MKNIKSLLKALLFSLLLCVAACGMAAAESGEMDNYEYLETAFRIEDQCYHPYLPTFVDPLNCFGYLSAHGGVSLDGEMYYVSYHCENEEWAALYRDYLGYWGYACAPMDCDLPGVSAWRMTSTDPAPLLRPLLPTVEVYYNAERSLLVVGYSYLDVWIIDEWLRRPEWGSSDYFDFSIPPFTLPLRDDAIITVEEIVLADSLFVATSQELSVYPYTLPLLEEHRLTTTTLGTADVPVTHYYLDAGTNNVGNPAYMVCVRLSFNNNYRKTILKSLRAAVTDLDIADPLYADCVAPSMLMLTALDKEQRIFTLPTETEDADLWLVFPPSIYESGDKLRLYFCMADEDNPWIGELRDWRVMNFSVTYAMLN